MVPQSRKILRHKGIRPLKRFGQSFLEDQNIISKIVASADLKKDDTVIEIGAGLGIMTESIARLVARVVALEIDPYMISILKDRLNRIFNIEIIRTDVLKYDFSGVDVKNSSQKLKIIGNVPYNISSQILFYVLGFRDYIGSIVIMLQKEMADRIMAMPGTKEYGIPSVIAQMYADITREVRVPASCFFPEPKVDSTVLKFVIREKPLFDLRDEDTFLNVVKVAFAHRRKTLQNNLRNSNLLDRSLSQASLLLHTVQIDAQRRAETLTVEEFGRLSNALTDMKNARNDG
jgi:16S rRNA (adenine1518-N6/adenine1519-N6)-dimethyltransferase